MIVVCLDIIYDSLSGKVLLHTDQLVGKKLLQPSRKVVNIMYSNINKHIWANLKFCNSWYAANVQKNFLQINLNSSFMFKGSTYSCLH